MQDSAPPATITSASPKAMNREASPIECAPVVQAVVTAWFGPWKPYFMAMCPAAMLVNIFGTNSGDTFLLPYRAILAFPARLVYVAVRGARSHVSFEGQAGAVDVVQVANAAT